MKPTFLKAIGVALVAAMIVGCSGPEERKARYLEKGEEYFAERNFEKANVEFRNALQIDPTDANARYKLGTVAEKLGNPRDAVGHFQAAIDADPKHLTARAALGRLYLLAGLPDKAMELAEPGLTQDPKNAQLLTVRGAAKAQLGDVPGAFEDAETAVEIGPNDEYAIALLASLYRQNARSDKAIEIVRAGIERLPNTVDLRVVLADLEIAHQRPSEAEQHLKKVVELQPDELTHRYRLARFYLMAKDVDAAERTLRAVVEHAPDSVDAKVALTDLLAAHRSVEVAEKQLQEFAASDEEGAQMDLALARFYESRDRAADAERVYRGVIESQQRKPDGLMARNRLASMLVQRKELDGARKLIEEVLEENARDNDALVMRGNLALARGDAPAAITDLRSVLRDQPNSLPVMRALARAHLQNNELALAEETLRSAAQASPTDRAVRLELSQLLTQSGRSDQARPILEQLIAETPGDIASLEALFKVQAASKDLASARTTAESITRVRPDLPLGAYLMGVLNEAEQRFDAAIAAYERAIEIQPTAGEPLTALIRVDLARKEPARARARLDKIIAEQPDNVVARNLLGEFLSSQGQLDSAVAAFEEAIKRAPQWWVPYRGLAHAHLAAKQVQPAIETFARGYEASGAAALGTALAELHERSGRPQDAIAVYERMIAREPNSLTAANNLAMLLVSYRSDRESLDRAQELLVRLNHVEEPAVLNTRGWVKYKRGEYQESLSLLRQAVDKSPESPVMRYHLGMAQLRTGDTNAARENLEAAITAGRSFHGIKEAQAALDELKRSG